MNEPRECIHGNHAMDCTDPVCSAAYAAGIGEALHSLRLVGLTDPACFYTTDDNMRGRYEALGRCINAVMELLPQDKEEEET